jgi:hypothetical protein
MPFGIVPNSTWRKQMDADLRALFDQAQSVTDKLRALELQEQRNFITVQAQGYVSFSDEQQAKQSMLNSLMYNYMKPSTATTPAGMEADAQRDANYLLIAAKVLWPSYKEFVYGVPQASDLPTQQ